MAENKYTTRMALTDLINDKNTDKVKEWARNEIAKLDKKNARRKTPTGEIKVDNKPIAEAIIKALENGAMLSTDLAKYLAQFPEFNTDDKPISTQKVNGVAGEMTKLGILIKTKVKIKGKGEQTSYSLATENSNDEE